MSSHRSPASAHGEHLWFRDYPVLQDNILWHWDQATPDEIERGSRWYADAHRVAIAIAAGNAHLGAGMLAVYSPQQGWIGNVLNAARVLRHGAALGGPGSGIFASTSQKIAADRLLRGERYEDVLNGPKVRDFAHLIEFAGDRDPDTPRAVIDRHALSVACGRVLTSYAYSAAPLGGFRRKDGSITQPQYDRVVRLYRQAAEQISAGSTERVAAHQVQAVTWLVRQRLNERDEQERGLTRLDQGRNRSRVNTERAWREFRAAYLPGLVDCPGTGYQAA